MFCAIQALVIQTSSVSVQVEQCVGCKALRLRGGWSPPRVRPYAWLTRRELAAWAACGAGAALAPRAAHAFAPPVGNVELLVPLLRCRGIIAEQREAAARASIDWRGVQLVLSRAPLTEARRGKAAAVVGSGFGVAAAAYDESLRYLAEIDESDRTFCYVSKAVKVDAQCLQRLYTSDRTYRTLLRNEVLTQLQALEAEAAYQARCTL
jgi:hypothetical protein